MALKYCRSITGVTSSMKLRHIMGGHTVTLDSATEALEDLAAEVEGTDLIPAPPTRRP